MAEPCYTTPDAVRGELGLSMDDLPDDAAVALIRDAEDAIDARLGFRLVDPDTGRKVVQADVEPWQWDKLSAATVKLAALIHSDPTVVDGPQWQSVTGPDFATVGPLGPSVGRRVINLLNASGLRRMGGRAVNRCGTGAPMRDFARDIDGPYVP